MATKLVYNGSVTTSFVAIGIEVNPGDEFTVPDELAESFLQRPDIEPVDTDRNLAEPDDVLPPVPPKVDTIKKSDQPTPEPKTK